MRAPIRWKSPLLASFVAIALPFGLRALAHEDEQGEGPHHRPPRTMLAFATMYGVDGPFLGDGNEIRGVEGDEAPWTIATSIRGRLDTDGNLHLRVRGLVFKDSPLVQPPSLVGTNDEAEFRGLVSCLTEDGDQVKEVNVKTRGFPADAQGNSNIDAQVALPNPCVAPIVFVLAGSEDKWFAVTGFEQEEGE